MIKTYIHYSILAFLLTCSALVGCSSLHITVPSSFKTNAIVIPVEVNRKASFLGNKEGKVQINIGGIKTRLLTAKESSEAVRVNLSGVLNVSLTSSDEVEQYSFQIDQKDKPSVIVHCIIGREKTGEELHLSANSSVGNEKVLKTSMRCEAQSNNKAIGQISIDRGYKEKTLNRSFTYQEETYQISSIHTVQNWNMKRRSPYGYRISRDSDLLTAIQVNLPFRLLTKPSLSEVDLEATLFFFLSVIYYDELFSSTFGVF